MDATGNPVAKNNSTARWAELPSGVAGNKATFNSTINDANEIERHCRFFLRELVSCAAIREAKNAGEVAHSHPKKCWEVSNIGEPGEFAVRVRLARQ